MFWLTWMTINQRTTLNKNSSVALLSSTCLHSFYHHLSEVSYQIIILLQANNNWAVSIDIVELQPTKLFKAIVDCSLGLWSSHNRIYKNQNVSHSWFLGLNHSFHDICNHCMKWKSTKLHVTTVVYIARKMMTFFYQSYHFRSNFLTFTVNWTIKRKKFSGN